MSRRAIASTAPTDESMRLGRIRRAVALARSTSSSDWLRRAEELDAAVRLATNSAEAHVEGYTRGNVEAAFAAYEAHVGGAAS